MSPPGQPLPDLCVVLLRYGGERVCVPFSEPDGERLLTEGAYLPAPRVIFLSGESNRCHSSSAAYWLEHRDSCELMTGYALAQDGIWRQHTWIRRSDGDLVESTIPWQAYYGFPMAPLDAYQFACANGGPAEQAQLEALAPEMLLLWLKAGRPLPEGIDADELYHELVMLTEMPASRVGHSPTGQHDDGRGRSVTASEPRRKRRARATVMAGE